MFPTDEGRSASLGATSSAEAPRVHAGFTSGACQNPTLTIMALTVRSSDYLMGELKKGNL